MNKNDVIQSFKLKDVATIRAGYAFRKKIEPAESGVCVIQMKDVSMRSGLNISDLTQTILPGREPRLWCQKGDIVFLARGSHNFASYVPNIRQRTVCSPHFFHIRINEEKILPKFIVWQINQQPTQDYLSQHGTGKSINNISREVLENLQIVVPSYKEQERILALEQEIHREQEEYEELFRMRKSMMTDIAFSLNKSFKS